MKEHYAIILPIEIQVRELDAKLFFACLAAERGFSVILGCYSQVNQRLHEMPRSVYLGKGVSHANARLFRDAQRLGHAVAAWDEEAVVYMSPEFYLRRKTSPEALAAAGALFAWGEDNARIWRAAPGYAGQPLFTTGNPRADLMRPELRAFYVPAVEDLRARFGNFVLINSNFGHLNHYRPNETLSITDARPDISADKRGTLDDPDMLKHRHALFQAFRQMVPQLARQMPERRLVVRPHPSEDHALWRELAAGCSNVEVIGKGNVLPWLMAAQAVIHNGCTTGLESFLLGRPAIAYEPVSRHPDYEIRLPNALSHSATDIESLIQAVADSAAGALPITKEQQDLARDFVTSMNGQFASEKILEAFEDLIATGDLFGKPGLATRAKGQIASRRRRLRRIIKDRLRGTSQGADYVRHRFPDIGVVDLEKRIARFRAITGRFARVCVRKRARNVFEITH